MEKHNELGVRSSITHLNSLIQLKQDPKLINMHQITSSQTFSKCNKKNMRSCDT